MTPAPKKLGTPLSEDDYATLDDFVEKHCRVDFDHLLGLLSAVAVAPGIVPPSAWLPAVLSDSPPKNEADARLGVGLLLRLFNEALTALDERAVYVPEAEETEELERFARGYVAGAQLDPEWTGDEDRWTFAGPFAYLAGERDLVPPDMLDSLDASDEAREDTRKKAGVLVLEAHRAFKAYRSRTIASATRPASLSRVGRNDPCPCGSRRYELRPYRWRGTSTRSSWSRWTASSSPGPRSPMTGRSRPSTTARSERSLQGSSAGRVRHVEPVAARTGRTAGGSAPAGSSGRGLSPERHRCAPPSGLPSCIDLLHECVERSPRFNGAFLDAVELGRAGLPARPRCVR